MVSFHGQARVTRKVLETGQSLAGCASNEPDRPLAAMPTWVRPIHECSRNRGERPNPCRIELHTLTATQDHRDRADSVRRATSFRGARRLGLGRSCSYHGQLLTEDQHFEHELAAGGEEVTDGSQDQPEKERHPEPSIVIPREEKSRRSSGKRHIPGAQVTAAQEP